MANAGIASFGSVLEVDPEAFKTAVDVNVMGVFYTVRAALPSVIERRGYVLVVSSVAPIAAVPGLASYDASKAGVEHFANALRLEVAHRGVDVGSAHMSWIDTPLVRERKADLATFREMLAKPAWAAEQTTSVEKCGDAFVKGIEAASAASTARVGSDCSGGCARCWPLRWSSETCEVRHRICYRRWTPKPPPSAARFSARTEALEKH